MLDDSLRTQLEKHFELITRPVEIVAAPGEGEAAGRVRSLLDDLAHLSGSVAWREADGNELDDDRRPLFAIGRPGELGRMRFAGLPMGHEFTSLVLAVLHAGGHPPRAEPELLADIEALPGGDRFETFVSLSCQTCPGVVQALNLFASRNPGITHTMVDGSLFQDEVESRDVKAVPSVFRNGEPFSTGGISERQILEKLDSAAADRAAEQISKKEPFEILVIGGGPAGAAAAIYAARKGIRTGLVAERFGGQLMDTLGIENFISTPHTEGPQLAAQLEEHVRSYDVDVMLDQRVEAMVDGGQSEDGRVKLTLASGAEMRASRVILATGARWRTLGVPGEEEHRNRGVAYCPHCDGPLFKGKRVAVIGGGNSGVEAALDLAGVVEHVTVVEFQDALLADAVLQERLRSLPNVDVILNAATTEVKGGESGVAALVYTDRASGESHEVALEGVFVQIGLLPNTEFLKDTRVELSPRGEIVVDDRGQTSAPGVFAAGDVTIAPTKQIVIAMGSGANAAVGAFDDLIRSPVESAEQEKLSA